MACGFFPDTFIPFGIEISTKAAKVADATFRQRGGFAINAPCVEGLQKFETGFFQAGSLRSYLEHEAEVLPLLLSCIACWRSADGRLPTSDNMWAVLTKAA